MTDNRLHGETNKIETPFGTLFCHFDYMLDGRLAGFSISHQMKDKESRVAELIENIASSIHLSIRARL